MPSIGLGVNKDNAAAPLRLTFYSDAHVDAQNDQANNYRYDLSKIWACMGRAGVNGVMRDGLIERGDPYLGYAAGSIQEFIGGVFGVENWDLLTAAGLNGVAGDMLYGGALYPWDDWLFHLAGIVVGPSPWVSEYWNGAAWAADTVTLTPDFTGNTGLNQRLRCVRPTNWVAVAGGAAGEVRYWRRIRQTGAGAAVLTNAGYKDFFQGHVRDFFCEWDIKKGDDGAGTNTSEFRDDSPFTLRFKDGRRFDSRTTISTFVQMGSVSNASRRGALGKPWSIISNRGHILHPCKLYGGYVMGNPQAYTTSVPGPALRGQGSEIVGTRIAGFHDVTLGATGVAVLSRAQDIRVSIDRDAANVGQRPILGYAIDPNGVADDVTIDVHDVSTVAAVSTTVASPSFRGLKFTHDAGTMQINRQGGSGPLSLYLPKWGGPTNKVGGALITPATPGWEIRILPFRVWRYPDFVPLPGIAVRATGSDGFKQLEGVTDANGQCLILQNRIAGIAIIGIQNQQVFVPEIFTDATGATSTLLDEPMRIEINPADHANFNPAYESHSRYTRWPRELIYDSTTGAYAYQDWQRLDYFPIDIALSPPPPPPAPPPEYVTVDTPEVPYAPISVPAVPYSPITAPEVPYTPVVVPGSPYTPIEVPSTIYKSTEEEDTSGLLGWGLEWGIAWGGPSAGGGVSETEYANLPIPSTDYDPVVLP